MWGRLTLPLQTQEHTHVAPRFAHARASTPNKQYGPGDSDGRDTSKNPSIAWLDTLGRQRLCNWQISCNQAVAIHRQSEQSHKHACDRENSEHLNQGDNAHVSIYPPAYGTHTPLEPTATWCQPNFCRCNEFFPQFVTLTVLKLAFGILIPEEET